MKFTYQLTNLPTYQLYRSRSYQSNYLIALRRHHPWRRGFQVQPQQRFRIRRPHVEMPVGILDRHSVEGVLASVAVLRRDLIELGRHQVHAGQLRVDLPGNEILARERLQEFVEALLLLRHQLQDQQRRNETVVGVEVVAEIVVPRDLAAEDGVGLAHPALEERVADAVHVRSATVPGHNVLHRVTGAKVVDDRCTGVFEQEGLGEQGGDEVARDELPGAVDEEAAIGVAVPGDADVGLLRHDRLDDIAAILLDEWIRFMIRKAPVDVEAEPGRTAGQAVEQLWCHQAAHPAACVEDDVERFDDRG